MFNTNKNESEEFEYRAFRCLLKLSKEQDNKGMHWFEELRWLYNDAQFKRKDEYQKKRRTIRYTEQQNALPALKKQRPSLKQLHSQVLQNSLKRLELSYDAFFRRLKERKEGRNVKAGTPRYKKFGQVVSFTYPQVWTKQTQKTKKNETTTKTIRWQQNIKLRTQNGQEYVKLEKEDEFEPFWGSLVLPKFGEVKIRVHRNFDLSNAKEVTIKKMADGRWFACIALQFKTNKNPEKECSAAAARTTGVDVGLKKLYTLSDGSYQEHPRFLRKNEVKLKKEQRKLSRKKKGSANYQKQRVKVAKVHQKIKDQRVDFLHKLSFWLVMSFDALVFEDLKIPNMVKNRRLAKSILDAGWGTLIDFVTYKSVMLGTKVKKVDPHYTSQDCSGCGARVPKTLAQRIHDCPTCGLSMCRDQNAARNLENKGRAGTARTK